MMKNKKYSLLSAGFIALLISIVTLIVAYVFYTKAFATFKYKEDKTLVAATFIALWLMIVLLVTGLLDKKRSWIVTIVYAIIPLLIAYSFIKLLMPSLTVIGTYFSPAGEAMGDVATNRVGVPQTIYGAVFYVISVVALVFSSFFEVWREKKDRSNQGPKLPLKERLVKLGQNIKNLPQTVANKFKKKEVPSNEN